VVGALEVTPRERLLVSFSPELVEAITRLVDERVSVEVAALASANGRQWLTLDEAGARLGVSADAVRMRVRRGRPEAQRQGRRLYVSAASVERLA
jgi:DNA-directed RNA polymerase specialized sigma24 family protein